MAIARHVHAAARELSALGASSTADFESKFQQDAHELSYAPLATFFTGLEGLSKQEHTLLATARNRSPPLAAAGSSDERTALARSYFPLSGLLLACPCSIPGPIPCRIPPRCDLMSLAG